MESLLFDELDLRILQALEADGRAPFSRIAEVIGVSDQTVARRYRRLVADGGLRVVGLKDSQVLGLDNWMLRLRCAPEGAETIAAALARRPDTSWIGLTSGGTEIVCGTVPRSPGDHDDLLLGKLPRTPHIVEIRAQLTLHRFFGGPEGWLRKYGPLTADQVAALRPPPPDLSTPVTLTPEDDALLAVLKRDGRATYPELQRATGRSESAVKRRLAQLLGSGALYIDVEYDLLGLGYGVAAMLWITAAPRHLDEVGRALAGHQEIAHAAATAGPSNLVATALARDTADLYRYVSGKLGHLKGVEHVETAPFMRRVKQLTYRPPLR
ncbi:Lrp/AsnC family transcriptional regulator [Streptomyces sp. VRA16 Mangrove soil]|uniref:Lrp/AsnC family transcriptional regulator n=1 Tax=Streptomyces sp. VRA16 Mangrove soil TaxID=2817434 RepID=UPI001A9D00D2|nr:Lrp/AsnC family transcriptional regulator [Streptomyces sp. VRA16 Mangrove soil]MBO1331038.1 Lrp/AsnC family transcriptional regulator [Streptomyces sp. VRA16 Mangrove soil]